jgi:hypothetical protein
MTQTIKMLKIQMVPTQFSINNIYYCYKYLQFFIINILTTISVFVIIRQMEKARRDF